MRRRDSSPHFHGYSRCGKRVETVHNSSFDWAGSKEVLKSRLGSEVVSRWLDPLSLATADDHSVVLEAPNLFFRDWVASHYLEAMRLAAGGREVRVVTASSPSIASVIPRALEPLRPAEPAPRSAAGAEPAAAPSEWAHGLNPRLTFDRFVVGPSNRFAHAASLAVAESPAKAYNPLFIYGGVGLGKTHVMQAIGHAILKRWPARRVVYLSSERFTNELIAAIQSRTTTKFRERYRSVDVLLIDDIHFIAQKEATQEEFFHTFNTLYDAHKQIVLSSDRSPKEISGLEERLVSRFEWGLVTDIQSPDLETRIAILRKKAEESQIRVPDDVTGFIAQQITANIRELEGALIRVVAYCTLFNTPLSAAVARDVLKDMVKEVRARITLEDIQRRVAEYFQVEPSEIRGGRRQRSILYPRQVAMFLCRRLTEASLPEIGQAFGGRDHTTVMHAVDKIEREIAQDTHKKQLVEHLNQLVLSASQTAK
ncbi:MAG: chromosomal replication initiator protein DnaA [Candidatus Omnitrophica bacterium CG11_big_fil_rev_8_21_14_0_20_63_9]|nr:MAG: chromosomal replication initiator protein DnaA [Candidatus Omnitrophica bacterium CG11_big_fil_rev_8_21_14_0_20_63_9]